MSEHKVVWSSDGGDTRKKNQKNDDNSSIDESSIILELRRLTSGKGRAVVEIKNLPSQKAWCKKLAKELKKSLGVGGAYKNDFIEVHGEKLEQVKEFLNSKNIKWKQVGG